MTYDYDSEWVNVGKHQRHSPVRAGPARGAHGRARADADPGPDVDADTCREVDQRALTSSHVFLEGTIFCLRLAGVS